MYCVAEWIEERAEVARDRRAELPDVRCRNTNVVGEGSIGIDAEDLHELADMRLSAAALQAVAAGNVHLGGDEVAHLHILYQFADSRHGAAELMSRNVGRLDAGLGPLVPVIDVQVGATDGGCLYGNEYIAGSKGWNRHLAHLHSWCGGCFYKGLHGLRNHDVLCYSSIDSNSGASGKHSMVPPFWHDASGEMQD